MSKDLTDAKKWVRVQGLNLVTAQELKHLKLEGQARQVHLRELASGKFQTR